MTREELKQKKIAVLLGGLSAERDVSLRTGKAVLNALENTGYRVTGIDVDRSLPARLAEEQVEVAFIALHGRYGEDGIVQGLLEMLGIAYTGSGVQASSLAMDKITTKKILIHHGIPTPAFRMLYRGAEVDALVADCTQYPLVVKPAREGSTIGITIARDEQALRAGIAEAFELDDHLLVEDFIQGAEVTVGVLDGTALPVIQVVPRSGFYDYTSKYTPGQTEYVLPAPLEAGLYGRIQQAAVEACAALGCRGAARVDFMVRGQEFFCLEVNTIPGMTETSLLPKAAAHAGIDFPELAQRILEGAGLNK